MSKRQFLIGYRLFFGLLGLSAVITEIAVLVERGTFIPSNFFSFFTIESNLFAAGVLLLGAFALAMGKERKWVTLLRGASTLYMAMTGIIFAVFLSGLQNVHFTAVPWDNIVLHYIMPAAVLVDWFIDLPKKRLAFNRALLWFIFPLAYLGYSLVRGHVVGWYPYPFLNPADDGYLGVAIVGAIISLATVFLIGLLVCASRLRARA